MKSAYEFYQEIAKCLVAYNNCLKSNNKEWENKWEDKINELVKNHLVSGGGFDTGTKFDWEKSNHNKLVFNTAFHHMNEGGYYDGWTEHQIIITPDLMFGFNIKITGKNRNDIKEYIHTVFSDFVYRE